MACATLKRSLEWEPVLGARPAKRRRCVPFSSSPTQREMGSSGTSTTPMGSTSPKNLIFSDVLSSKLTQEHLIDNLKAEIKRLQKRKQLHYNNMETSDGGSSGGESYESEKPLFTFKQVGLICERMLRERELEIREEYDQVLRTKLEEQYEAFVRFTQDQIHRHYTNTPVPSYLS